MTQRIRGEERRAQLLDVALTLFAEQGYDGTSTRAIAAAAGITEGLIFRHFPTKRDLLRAVIERYTPSPEQPDLERQIEPEPIHQALTLLLDCTAAWFWENRQFIRMVIMESFRQGEAFQELAVLMERGPAFLQRLLERRVAAGEIVLSAPSAAAEMLSGALFAFFQRHQHRGEAEWRRLSHQFEGEVIRLFLAAACPPEASFRSG